MSPVDYTSFTRSVFSDHQSYQWSYYKDAPLTPLAKNLDQCRVALISSGGLYPDGQEPFNPIKNDLTIRRISRDADMSRLRVSHDNYDNMGVKQDTNCVFPLDRLKEMEETRIIKEAAPSHYTFMGRCFKRTEFLHELTPQIIRSLQQESVDLCYLVPA